MTGFGRNASLSLLAAAFLSPAFAANKPDEIIVSTRKLDENISDVPVAITAFGSQVIEEARIQTLEDVAALTPGLNFFNPIGESLPVPVIRGIAPTDIFGDPNAAVFVDGVYAAGREGLNFSLLNVERIEVNKGPQSSLYGRNAFSGAINYVTKRPGDELAGSAEVTAGDRGRVGAKAFVSGPLSDTWGGSLGFGYDTWDGSYDNPISNVDVGGYEYTTLTGSLEWSPSDTFDALFNVYYSDDEIDDPGLTSQIADCENTGSDSGLNRRLANVCGELWDLDQVNADLNANIPGNPNIPDNLEFFTGSDEIAKIPGSRPDMREVTRMSLNLNWDRDYGSISALTGYSRVEFASYFDGTRNRGFTQPFVYCDMVGGYANVDPMNPSNDLPFCSDFATPKRFTTGLYVVAPTDTTEELSQEVRFTSPQDQSLRYSVGGYYFQFDSRDQEAYVLANAPMLPAGLGDPTGPGTMPPGAAFGPWPGFGIAIGDAAFRPWFTPTSTAGTEETISTGTEAWSVFGTIDWDINDRLTADFQLRFTDETRDYKVVAPSLNAMRVRTASEDSTYVTGRAGLKFELNDNTMIYGSISNGSKPAGFDADVVDVLNQGGNAESRIVIVPFKEEKLLAYEFGVKGDTADGFFRYDVATYLMDWKDIVIPQVFNNDPITGEALEQPEGFNTNAGDATVYGAEFQGNFVFTDNWFAGFGVSYTDAELDKAQLESFADFPSFMPDGNVAGNKLLRQPEWMGNVNVRYSQPLDNGWEWITRVDATYQDEYFGGLDNQWTVPSHTYVNFRTALESERYTVSFWGKNIFNDDSPVAAFRDVFFGNTDDLFQTEPASSTPSKFFPWRLSVTHPKLRTVGVTVAVRFGN